MSEAAQLLDSVAIQLCGLTLCSCEQRRRETGRDHECSICHTQARVREFVNGSYEPGRMEAALLFLKQSFEEDELKRCQWRDEYKAVCRALAGKEESDG